MKVDKANLSPLNGTDESGRKQAPPGSPNAPADDVHLSELVRSLRSLVPDSPERQERIEQIARAYANGSYKVDADATASKLIDDSLPNRW
jgi:flagellar biosynthesis anti-sigma factor FlgM